MTSFDKTWARQETRGLTDRIRDTVKPEAALKPRIQTAVNKLQVQISKIEWDLCREIQIRPNWPVTWQEIEFQIPENTRGKSRYFPYFPGEKAA